MKLTSFWLAVGLGLALGTTSCKKEAMLTSENASISEPEQEGKQTKSYAIAQFESEQEYSDYLDRATDFFYSSKSGSKPKGMVVNNDFKPSAEQMAKVKARASKERFMEQYIKTHVEQYHAYQIQFPEQKGNVTAWSYFVDALENGTEADWKEAADNYPELFQLTSTGIFGLTHTTMVSAMINMDAAYMLNGELIQYSNNAVRVYDADNFDVVNGTLAVKNARAVKQRAQKTASRGYSMKYNNFFTYTYLSNIGMRLQGLEDIVLGDGCFGWRVYCETRAYTFVSLNGQWVPLPSQHIMTIAEWTYMATQKVDNHYAQHWGTAGGNLGCGNSSSESLLSHAYFVVDTGWAWLGSSSSYY